MYVCMYKFTYIYIHTCIYKYIHIDAFQETQGFSQSLMIFIDVIDESAGRVGCDVAADSEWEPCAN